MSGRAQAVGILVQLLSDAPLGHTKPWLRTSSASPRMPVTAPSVDRDRSPQVASHSGHVLKAIGHPRRLPRACAATSSARSMPASSTSRWVTARTRVGPKWLIDHVLAASAAEKAAASGTRR